MYFQPSCHRQGQFPLDEVAQSLIQAGLDYPHLTDDRTYIYIGALINTQLDEKCG